MLTGEPTVAKKNTATTLVHPDGKRTYDTSDPVEITRLTAQGYTVKSDKPAPKPQPSS
jgi:hypothetical protein